MAAKGNCTKITVQESAFFWKGQRRHLDQAHEDHLSLLFKSFFGKKTKKKNPKKVKKKKKKTLQGGDEGQLQKNSEHSHKRILFTKPLDF